MRWVHCLFVVFLSCSQQEHTHVLTVIDKHVGYSEYGTYYSLICRDDSTKKISEESSNVSLYYSLKIGEKITLKHYRCK